MRFIRTSYFFGIIALIGIIFLGYFLFQVSKSRNFQFFGRLTAHVPTNQKIVALTFDDAPSEFTEEILATLKHKQIKATFYSTGSNLELFPEQGKHIASDGHELGNHSYSHERFLLKSQHFIDEEIQKTNTLIRKTGYEGEITFRPPNGKKLFGLPWYLQQHNIQTIMWDVEPDTYVDANSDEKTKTAFLVTYTVDNTKPGSIILLHPFCKACTSDRRALPRIIDALKKKEYTFVTISELLKYNK